MPDLQSETRRSSAVEIGTLAREMARAYKGMTAFYRDQMELSGPEADAKARDAGDPRYLERIMESPPDQISWWNLSTLEEKDFDTALKVWERIKSEARDELESGHRAIDALDFDSSPWARAQFLAIRNSFREEWIPRGGIEASLIDMLAQSYSNYLMWVGRLTVDEISNKSKQDSYWQPPRLSAVESMEQSAGMADRFHRIFMRTLRALRDLRRYSPSVIVQNAGQVNVGSQQINVGQNV